MSYGVFLVLLMMFHFAALWQKHQLTLQLDQLNKEVSIEQQELAAAAAATCEEAVFITKRRFTSNPTVHRCQELRERRTEEPEQ